MLTNLIFLVLLENFTSRDRAPPYIDIVHISNYPQTLDIMEKTLSDKMNLVAHFLVMNEVQSCRRCSLVCMCVKPERSAHPRSSSWPDTFLPLLWLHCLLLLWRFLNCLVQSTTTLSTATTTVLLSLYCYYSYCRLQRGHPNENVTMVCCPRATRWVGRTAVPSSLYIGHGQSVSTESNNESE